MDYAKNIQQAVNVLTERLSTLSVELGSLLCDSLSDSADESSINALTQEHTSDYSSVMVDPDSDDDEDFGDGDLVIPLPRQSTEEAEKGPPWTLHLGRQMKAEITQIVEASGYSRSKVLKRLLRAGLNKHYAQTGGKPLAPAHKKKG